MSNNLEIGTMGENLACQYLEKNNYKILERNYRYKRSEIDIIAKKGDLIVFIEVKTRSGHWFGTPEQSVNEKKAQKVMEGADQYIY